MRVVCLISWLCLAGLSGCETLGLPPAGPKDPDPAVHALVRDILERGAAAVAPQPVISVVNGVEDVEYPPETLFLPFQLPLDFTGIVPEHAFYFLGHTQYTCAPPAHFSCAIMVCPHEQSLYEAALKHPSPAVRLQALALLMAARSCGVEAQDAALCALRREVPAWEDVLSMMAATLEGKRAAAELAPGNGHAIRVCGYRREPAAVAGLVQLAATDGLDCAKAATLALAQIPGAAADDGLARVVGVWRYDMREYAAAALYRRAPKKLAAALRAMETPREHAWKWAYLRVACGDTEAVPLLAAMIPQVQDYNRTPLRGPTIRARLDMVKLVARAATADQAAIVHAMPGQVAPEDQEMARRWIALYFLQWQGKKLVDE